MHELSIALNIVELAVEEAHRNNAGMVVQVEVEIGTMSGVEIEALQFAWDSAILGTPAEKASLEIKVIQAEARCLDCENLFPVQNFFVQCPQCGSYRYEIFQGRELKIRSLVVE